MIIGIVAVGRNYEIGKKNGLLFNIPFDLARFKTETTGHFVVCGYNTLLSFPKQKPLPNRVTICLAPEGIERNDCLIVHTLEDCLKLIRNIEKTGNPNVYIIGGGMLYKSFLPYYDLLLITKVDAEDKDATVFFPNIDKDINFKLVKESETLNDNNYNIKFCEYERLK